MSTKRQYFPSTALQYVVFLFFFRASLNCGISFCFCLKTLGADVYWRNTLCRFFCKFLLSQVICDVHWCNTLWKLFANFCLLKLFVPCWRLFSSAQFCVYSFAHDQCWLFLLREISSSSKHVRLQIANDVTLWHKSVCSLPPHSF